jgi:hypothetical protein
MINFGDILRNIDYYDWHYAVYSAANPPFTAGTDCEIEPSNSDDVARGLSKIIEVLDLKGMVADAYQNKPDVTNDELINAFNYYMRVGSYVNWW